MLASVIHGCMAVASGMCRHVLVYRALNEATAWRQSTERVATDAGGVTGIMQWILPFGAFSGPNWMGLYARRHMHEYGTTREQIAQISLNARRNAALNPKAVLTKELTLDDYLASPMISDPLCLYDCDIAIDGATAVVISDAGVRARYPEPGHPLRSRGERAARSRLVGSVGGHDDDRGDERRRASVVADRSEAEPTSTAPSYTTASRCLSLYWLEGLQFCGQRRERRVRRRRRAHQPDRRAAAGHQRGSALGRPAAQLRPPVRGVPPAARGSGRASGAGGQGGGGVGGRGAVGFVPAAH